MKKSEVVKFVEDAIKHVETNNVDKKKFAHWLKEKFNIALKEIVLKPDEGFKPYILVEYLADTGKVEECYVNMEKYADKVLGGKTSFKEGN